MADVREKNLEIRDGFSAILEKEGGSFVSVLTFSTTYDSPPPGQHGWMGHDYDRFHEALLANRDNDESGVLTLNLVSEDKSEFIRVTRADTETGLDKYDDEFDYVPDGLSYPVIAVTIWDRKNDTTRSVATPYGSLPARVVDSIGNDITFDDRTFLFDAEGKDFQIQDVSNWGTSDEDTSLLPHVDFTINEEAARAVPISDNDRKNLRDLIGEIKEGKWSAIEESKGTKKIFDGLAQTFNQRKS